MIARILVAVLLSLAGAPVVQADSLSVLNDFCEGVRLQDAAFERWADDLPEGNGNWGLIEMHRVQVAERGPSGMPLVCAMAGNELIAGTFAETWVMSSSTLLHLDALMREADGMADVTGLKRRQQSDRFMSVETLVLFSKSKIHFTRAFLGVLDVMRDQEAKRLNIRD